MKKRIGNYQHRLDSDRLTHISIPVCRAHEKTARRLRKGHRAVRGYSLIRYRRAALARGSDA
ncbi:hypothetical protein [Paraburkholderia sp. Ac-20347]|uniref:hypothetical protein n=1 Tax=Paraburkholderia sp. Ac-20347 TaxID=2703892 RepID=UPI00197D11DD|nr:hypothetical protein [Paraburkholderia sp. Ac-20347]MBN3811913.1 hypothetical protein [Paraburkholderia sp. Ac-20347]